MSIIWAVLGAVAGSVANAVIDRLPRRESWFSGRSKCDKCKHELGVADLIPVVSYLSLGGRCRYCHKPIGRRNLFVEILMTIGFALIFNLQFSIYTQIPIFNVLILQAILWTTVVIAVMDWETMLVSDWLVGLWAVLIVLSTQYSVARIYGLLIGVGVIGGLWLITKKKGMGDGDIGIAAVMGYWLGWPKIAVGLWLAFVIGAVFGVWSLVFGKKTMKSQIPFGPFLIAGAWIGYVWGERIIRAIIGL